MSRKEKNRDKRSTRQLMGIDSITDYGLQTSHGEIAFLAIKPTNVSVLSREGMESRIRALTTVLKRQANAQMLCTNSRESFGRNKAYLKDRMAAETEPAIRRRLLAQDAAELDRLQTQMTTARQFLLCVPLPQQEAREVLPYLAGIEKMLDEQGFTAHRLGKEELKQLLAVYYEQNVTSDRFDDVDGARWLAPEDDCKVQNPVRPWKLKKEPAAVDPTKTFLDMVAPGTVKFNVDHYICGNTYRCVWALREYPTATEEQAILRHLGEKENMTLHLYTRLVSPAEEERIIHNAANNNRMKRASTNDLRQTVTAQSNLQDVETLVATLHRSREMLLHCAVYMELMAPDYDALKLLQTEVQTELVRAKLNVDRLLLRQQQGFHCVKPGGQDVFGLQYERVLPAPSVANLYPFNYSGKTDAHGFYIGRDRYGSNILVDFDQRDADKSSASVLILGNSGQGKSYLMKLLLCNFLEAGKSIISLDVEHEQQELCEKLGGCFVDLMAGTYHINVLEPKCWDDGGNPIDLHAPEPFSKATRLSQHISFLKDFFRAYKDFSHQQIDVIEIMVGRLYEQWGIREETDFHKLQPTDYPILSDLYALIEDEYEHYEERANQLYSRQVLQEILLGLHSLCRGADAQFFNGHTNVTSQRFLVFGVKGLLTAAKHVRSAMLFNVLSYMSDKLLTEGNTVAALDELYIWLSDNVAFGTTVIEYIRNALKRVRKKESAMILGSQNLEDFNQEGIRELTKPLFSIPPHQFLFNAGSINKRAYMDMLQLEESEYALIRYPQRGVCLFKCGTERYLLEVHAPVYKEALFGTAGGR